MLRSLQHADRINDPLTHAKQRPPGEEKLKEDPCNLWVFNVHPETAFYGLCAKIRLAVFVARDDAIYGLND